MMLNSLSHGDLLKLGNLLGYPINVNGVCNGFSAMLNQAWLAGDEKTFYARLELIESYNNDFDKLVKDIENARNLVKKGPLTNLDEETRKKTIQLLEIPAFYEGILLHLLSRLHTEIFNKFIHAADVESISPFTRPILLNENDDATVVFQKSYAFNRRELNDYLKDLETQFENTDVIAPINFYSSNHSVSAKYNKDTKQWNFVDTNALKNYSQVNRSYSRAEMVDNLFKAYNFGAYSANVLFTTTVIAKKSESTELKGKFEKLAQRYPITPQLVYKCDYQNKNLLFIACQNNEVKAVDALLKLNDIRVNQEDQVGITPLCVACQNGHLQIVQKLLNQKDIQVNGHVLASPLTAASKHGHYKVVRELLKHPSIKVDPFILRSACANGHLEVVQELLKYPGIELDKDLLIMAGKNGHIKIVRELLKQPEIQVNYDGGYVLRDACRDGNLPYVQELLKHKKIEVNAGHFAAAFGNLKVSKALMDFKLQNLHSENRFEATADQEFNDIITAKHQKIQEFNQEVIRLANTAPEKLVDFLLEKSPNNVFNFYMLEKEGFTAIVENNYLKEVYEQVRASSKVSQEERISILKILSSNAEPKQLEKFNQDVINIVNSTPEQLVDFLLQKSENGVPNFYKLEQNALNSIVFNRHFPEFSRQISASTTIRADERKSLQTILSSTALKADNCAETLWSNHAAQPLVNVELHKIAIDLKFLVNRYTRTREISWWKGTPNDAREHQISQLDEVRKELDALVGSEPPTDRQHRLSVLLKSIEIINNIDEQISKERNLYESSLQKEVRKFRESLKEMCKADNFDFKPGTENKDRLMAELDEQIDDKAVRDILAGLPAHNHTKDTIHLFAQLNDQEADIVANYLQLGFHPFTAAVDKTTLLSETIPEAIKISNEQASTMLNIRLWGTNVNKLENPILKDLLVEASEVHTIMEANKGDGHTEDEISRMVLMAQSLAMAKRENFRELARLPEITKKALSDFETRLHQVEITPRDTRRKTQAFKDKFRGEMGPEETTTASQKNP
jgi:ankyrin repeat protein